jgi:hypothetical protein
LYKGLAIVQEKPCDLLSEVWRPRKAGGLVPAPDHRLEKQRCQWDKYCSESKGLRTRSRTSVQGQEKKVVPAQEEERHSVDEMTTTHIGKVNLHSV